MRAFLPARRRRWATSRSSGTTPSRTLTTRMMTSAASMASCTWAKAASAMTSLAFSPRNSPIPPVSTSVKGRPSHSTSAVTRSRVTPGSLWTMAIRLPAMRLNSADFPTLGRPTMAIRPGITPHSTRDCHRKPHWISCPLAICALWQFGAETSAQRGNADNRDFARDLVALSAGVKF